MDRGMFIQQEMICLFYEFGSDCRVYSTEISTTSIATIPPLSSLPTFALSNHEREASMSVIRVLTLAGPPCR